MQSCVRDLSTIARSATVEALIVALTLLVPTFAAANERRAVLAAADAVAVPSTSPIVLDGKLNEEIWQQAPPVVDFVQRDPDEGGAPSQRTEARIAYDEEALYVAVRAFDTDSARIVGILTRRDQRSPAEAARGHSRD